jgi:hypothetical protein
MHRQDAVRCAGGLNRGHRFLSLPGAWGIGQRLKMLAKRVQDGCHSADLLVGHMGIGFQNNLGRLL